jgi:hypothetical protein
MLINSKSQILNSKQIPNSNPSRHFVPQNRYQMFKTKYPSPRSSPQGGEEVIIRRSSLSLWGEGQGEGVFLAIPYFSLPFPAIPRSK